MRGCFITGTDTGVGKTVLAGALLAALRERQESIVALKPFLTGLAEQVGPRDDEILAACAETPLEQITLSLFNAPASPRLAAELEGSTIDMAKLIADSRGILSADAIAIVEGAGGLLVPIANGWDMRDYARELGLPLLIAARPGLGTVNHTLLTIEAARAAGLAVTAVVLTPWPSEPTVLERSNAATIAELGEVEVATLPTVDSLTPVALAQVGAGLPLERWFRPPAPLN